MSTYSQIDPINGLEDTLWSAAQQSRVLQDLRRDIRPVWDDEAARELNARFLNPHETDDLSMRTEIAEQVELLKTVRSKIEVANELAAQAEELSKTIAEREQFARQDLESAYSNYDVYVEYNANACSKFPTIQELIGRANAAC